MLMQLHVVTIALLINIDKRHKSCNENFLATPGPPPKNLMLVQNCLFIATNYIYILVGNLGLVHSEEVILNTDLVTLITPGLT